MNRWWGTLRRSEPVETPVSTTAVVEPKPQVGLYIVIVGCGRLGSYLANRLSSDGHSVVVVDSAESVLARLSSDFSGFRIAGDATQIAVLREAKVPKADVLIATTHDDNVNLMVAQVAKKVFGTPKVIARIFDSRREAVYMQLGVQTICPTSVAAGLFLHSVREG